MAISAVYLCSKECVEQKKKGGGDNELLSVLKLFDDLTLYDKILDWSSFLKAFADNKLKMAQKVELIFRLIIERICGKRRKCWLLAFSPFSIMV